MRRFFLILAWLVVVILFNYFQQGTETARRPEREILPPPPVTEAERQPQAPTGTNPLPGPSRRDPLLRLADSDPCAQACSGTAFAIDGEGHWLTAHHVVKGCRQVALMNSPTTWTQVTEVASHPHADVSLLTSDLAAPAVPVAFGPLYKGQQGFHFGFPRGEPGDVHGELMGRIRVRSRRAIEPAVLWAEVDRKPENDLPLGGLSGGPVLNQGGGVVGVAIAASPRRGRVTSAAPRSLRETLEKAGVPLAEASQESLEEIKIAGSNYSAVGNHLRESLSVAKVLCWGQSTPRRRPSR